MNRRIYLSVAYPHENSTATIVSRNLNKLLRQETAEQWLPREQPEPAYAGSTGMMGQGRRGISSTDGRRFPLATGRMDESDEE